MEQIWTFLTSRPTDQGWLWWLVPATLQALALIVALLLAQAFLMYFDRKVWAAVQMRKGPNVVGPFGLLPVAVMAIRPGGAPASRYGEGPMALQDGRAR